MYILNGEKLETITSEQKKISYIATIFKILFSALTLSTTFYVLNTIPDYFSNVWFRMVFWVIFLPMIGMPLFKKIEIPTLIQDALDKKIVYKENSLNITYLKIMVWVLGAAAISVVIIALIIPSQYNLLFYILIPMFVVETVHRTIHMIKL